MKGALIHVHRKRSISIKQSFIHPKLPCNLRVEGFSLTSTTFYPHYKVNAHHIEGPKLNAQEATWGLRLLLKIWQVFLSHAKTKNDFKNRQNTLVNVLHWGFYSFYELSKQIGHNAFAAVHKAYQRISGKIFAVKTIDKSRHLDSGLDYYQREVNTLLMLKHLNIFSAIDLF